MMTSIESWAITILFVITAGYAVFRVGTRDVAVIRISQVLHIVMAAAMIAMTWRSQPEWLGWFQLAAFTLAGLWYLLPSVHRCERRATVVHAVMMFGMAWMAVVMIIRPAGTVATLAGVAVLVAFLAGGCQQLVLLAESWVQRRNPVRPFRTADSAIRVLMVTGMSIMTVPMISVAGA